MQSLFAYAREFHSLGKVNCIIAASQPVDMYSSAVGKHVKSQKNKETWVAYLTSREKTEHQAEGSVKDNTVAGTNYF